jgi:hypothetical protein
MDRLDRLRLLDVVPLDKSLRMLEISALRVSSFENKSDNVFKL